MNAHEHPRPIINGLPTNLPDTDPDETTEWLESLDGAIDAGGPNRARFLMLKLNERARERRIGVPSFVQTDYVNTIPVEEEAPYPGNEILERRIRGIQRWNSAVTVHRQQRPGVGVGGHISTYASAVTLYEVGLNHFWKGKDHPDGGDQIFFQGHAAPGMYARALLEGRLGEDDLDGFRQEFSRPRGGRGIPSYPHPRRMPDFWEFPTVSMGLGPINAIYQAQFNRYLENRGIRDTSQQQVWAFLGDGEMDEPESRGALQLAANDGLDNLTFVINCNLQRLDGPVRGNGKIMQELEAFFRGAGWNVVKVVWASNWDGLLSNDTDGALVNIMNSTPDGDFQTFKANDGGYVREHFFGRDPRTAAMVKDWTDDQVWALRRGGHDAHKVYNAYKAAVEFKGAPTVILAHTIKGYFLGSHFAGRNATHQMKKLALDDLKSLRDRTHMPVTDEQLEADPYLPPYYVPTADGPDGAALAYLHERRKALGGFVPERRTVGNQLKLPDDQAYASVKKGSGAQKIATTMAFVRLLKDLMRDKDFAPYVAPIIPDEARTFGMDSFFPTIKIYNPHGQNYTPVDHELMLSYREATNGQILHLGINEAGSVASFTAVGSSYATHGQPMVPIYVFYSMFGFQRTADAIWAASDQLARGFLIGATAGRTTLTGEGTQHMDGHSHMLAATNTGVISYDPSFPYEIAHIVRNGLERMYGENSEDVIYYLTVYNEPMLQPAEPEGVDVEGILRGMHLISQGSMEGVNPDARRAQLLASGVGVPWALEAQDLLKRDYGVVADVWSVTSWTELRRDGLACDEHNFLHPEQERKTSFVAQKLEGRPGPVVATSDYMRQVQDQIRDWVSEDYYTLGADGFGFSDTRAAARRVLHIDGPSMAVRTLQALADRGEVPAEWVTDAIARYSLLDVNAGTSGEAGGDA